MDYPNSSKAKKIFLVLFTGGAQKLPAALGTEQATNQALFSKREKVALITMTLPLYKYMKYTSGDGKIFSFKNGYRELFSVGKTPLPQ